MLIPSNISIFIRPDGRTCDAIAAGDLGVQCGFQAVLYGSEAMGPLISKDRTRRVHRSGPATRRFSAPAGRTPSPSRMVSDDANLLQ